MSAPWTTLYGCRDKLTGKPVIWEKKYPASEIMWDWDVNMLVVENASTPIPPHYLLTRNQACRIMYEQSIEPTDSIVPVWESFRVIPNAQNQKFMIAKVIGADGEVKSINGPYSQNQKMSDTVHLYHGLVKGEQVVFVPV